jgi:hypothetical protein
MNNLHEKRGIYEDRNLYIFTQQVPHWGPKDGFTIDTLDIDLTGSCPLTIHPFKDYETIFIPSYDYCSDKPLVDNFHTVAM